VYGNGLGLCPVIGIGINGVGSSGCYQGSVNVTVKEIIWCTPHQPFTYVSYIFVAQLG